MPGAYISGVSHKGHPSTVSWTLSIMGRLRCGGRRKSGERRGKITDVALRDDQDVASAMCWISAEFERPRGLRHRLQGAEAGFERLFGLLRRPVGEEQVFLEPVPLGLQGGDGI